jgi:uncharacterized membrane protein
MRKALGILGVVWAMAYPFIVYFGLGRLGARALGACLAAFLLGGVLMRMRGERREHALALARIPATLAGVLVLGAVLDDRRFVTFLPVLTNLVLLGHFGWSLHSVPIAERFARFEEGGALTAAQVGYCRRVTLVWCVFFVANGAITAALSLFAAVRWWTLYTGGISYAAVGLLASAEYVVRKARFRKYKTNPVDQLLARVFPPLAATPPQPREWQVRE